MGFTNLNELMILASKIKDYLSIVLIQLFFILFMNGSVWSAEPIKPIPASITVDIDKVLLGEKLFHDVKLSKDNTVSCASCHDVSDGGDDNAQVSTGIEGKKGVINAPTVFNVGFNFKQFWDGRAGSLEDQVDGPVQNVQEMGSIWPEVVAKLYQDDDYALAFKNIYADGITRENIKNAIAEYQRTLITPDSPFDRWLGGDENAITERQKRGYKKFKDYGCTSCHQGVNVGGNMFQVFGVLNSYFLERGNITEADMGRFNITGNKADQHAFKVPSLRMAAHTAPYLHDGTAETLRDAVDIMFRYQLGREAPDEDKNDIVEFINSLAGKYTKVEK